MLTEKVNKLPELAAQAGHDLETATAQDVLRWAHETFGDAFVIASSMGTNSGAGNGFPASRLPQ